MYTVRQKHLPTNDVRLMLAADLVEGAIGLAANLFYGTGLAACVLILRHTKPGRRSTPRTRFIVTDTLGLLLVVMVCTASRQDPDGAKSVLLKTYLRTRVRFVFADGAFAGRLLDWAAAILRTTVHIVRKPADQRGFAVTPRRWTVERTFAWLTAHRRLARDDEPMV